MRDPPNQSGSIQELLTTGAFSAVAGAHVVWWDSYLWHPGCPDYLPVQGSGVHGAWGLGSNAGDAGQRSTHS